MALWGAAAMGILVAYRPPTRHTRLDGLGFWKKLSFIDFTGSSLLASGLTLVLVGIALGGANGWRNIRVYVILPVGFAFLVGFGVYEWKFTKTGILHHDLFSGSDKRGRTFGISVALIFAEGLMLFAFVLFYPLITSAVYQHDPFIAVARQMPFWVVTLISTGLWAAISIRLKLVREPLAAAFLVFSAALAGMASIQPNNGTTFTCLAGLAGLGFGGLIVLIVTATQLSVPHKLITTATAITVSSRSVAASMAAAIYVAVFSARLESRLPAYVGPAVVKAGLPRSSVAAFLGDLAHSNTAGLPSVPGATPAIIAAGRAAYQQAFVDSARVIYIIAAPIGGLAFVLCFFMASMRNYMDCRVEAPVEILHAKPQEAAAVTKAQS